MSNEPAEQAAIEAFKAAQTDVVKAKRVLNAAQGALRHFQVRARDIVAAGRGISGVPKGGGWVTVIADGARIAHRKRWGWVVEVYVETYCGEGNYDISKKPIIFPARWLAMAPEDWQAELRELVAQRDQRLAQQAQDREAKKRQEAEDHERAELERLQAKYLGGDT